MIKYILVFILIVLMALLCSLESWGGCTDCEGYGHFSQQMQKTIEEKITIIPGFSVKCYPWGRSLQSETYCTCDLRFPVFPAGNQVENARSVHAAQNIADIFAARFREEVPLNTLLQAWVGNRLVYQIYYFHQFDLFQRGLTAPW